MKKIILGLCLVSTGLIYAGEASAATHNNDTNVPDRVNKSFHRDFKGVTEPQWKKEDGKWDVSFYKNDRHVAMTAKYNWMGHRIDSRMPVGQSALPLKVVDRLNNQYRGSFAQEFTKIDRPWKMDLYSVKIKEKGAYKTLYLDKNGHEHDYASR
jgi:hypothetical protein